MSTSSRRWRVRATLLGLLLTLAPLVLVPGCATRRQPQPAEARKPPPGPSQVGIASHYANRFAGRKTASGAIYRPELLTAAHRTLPLGTRVRVTRIDASGTRVAGPIEVVINDRGPYVHGRIIDLSAAAAQQLGLLGGIARVRVEVIGK